MFPSAPLEAISHTAEAIHQEVVFKATPERLYKALDQYPGSSTQDRRAQWSHESRHVPPREPTSPRKSVGNWAASLRSSVVISPDVTLNSFLANELFPGVASGRLAHGRFLGCEITVDIKGPQPKIVLGHPGFPRVTRRTLRPIGMDSARYWPVVGEIPGLGFLCRSGSPSRARDHEKDALSCVMMEQALPPRMFGLVAGLGVGADCFSTGPCQCSLAGL